MKTYHIYAGEKLVGSVQGDFLTYNNTTILVKHGEKIVAAVPVVGFVVLQED